MHYKTFCIFDCILKFSLRMSWNNCAQYKTPSPIINLLLSKQRNKRAIINYTLSFSLSWYRKRVSPPWHSSLDSATDLVTNMIMDDTESSHKHLSVTVVSQCVQKEGLDTYRHSKTVLMQCNNAGLFFLSKRWVEHVRSFYCVIFSMVG